MIPVSDPFASYKSSKFEIDNAIRRVLDSGWYVLGQEVESFEREFSAFHGPNFHSVGVANGTDAITISLKCLNIEKGDEVITTSHTAIATIAGIEQAGCKPVLADIDPITRCIDPSSIEKRIGPSTKAIIPVHIFGQPCDMLEVVRIARSNNLEIIEDCSQAHGAQIAGQFVGTFGSLATFSCYPTKNLGGTGDGGIILCNTNEHSEIIKSLRQYGWNKRRESITSGQNSRLDEIQAAILRVKLKKLLSDNSRRREIGIQYNEAFKELPLTLPIRKANERHAMHLYVIECEKRSELLNCLREQGVGASLHYPLAVHQHSAYSKRLRGSNDLARTEKFYQRHLTLPMFPELSADMLAKIISSVNEFFSPA